MSARVFASVLARVLATATLLGCGPGPSERSPLATLSVADRVEITTRSPDGGTMGRDAKVRDTGVIRRLQEIAAAPGDWAPVGLATAPSGDLRAAFFRDTVYLGVLSVGRGWIGARDVAGTELLRTMTPAESTEQAALRAAHWAGPAVDAAAP